LQSEVLESAEVTGPLAQLTGTYGLATAPEARALLEHVWGLIGGGALVRRGERIVRKGRCMSPAELCEAGLEIRPFGLEPAAS
jgi:hypothetical protein